MEIILIILAIYGLSNIIAYSHILQWFRVVVSNFSDFLYNLITCMMCMSYWFGIIAFMVYKPEFITTNYLMIDAIVFGFFTSGCVWLIHTTQEFLERR